MPLPAAVYRSFIGHLTVTSLSTYSDLSELSTYSETEHIVGKWIDSNILYEKTISIGQLPSSAGSKAVAHNISNLNKIVEIKGVCIDSNGISWALNYANVSRTSGNISMVADSTNVTVWVGEGQSSIVETYVTIRYTKTV